MRAIGARVGVLRVQIERVLRDVDGVAIVGASVWLRLSV